MQHPPAPGCVVWYMWHMGPSLPAGGSAQPRWAASSHFCLWIACSRALCSCSLSASLCMHCTKGSLWCNAALSSTFCLEGSPVYRQPPKRPLRPALLSAPRQCPSWVLNLQLGGCCVALNHPGQTTGCWCGTGRQRAGHHLPPFGPISVPVV